MNHKKIEAKWQKQWAKWKTDAFDKTNIDNKYYVLEMFSYPSAANLHIGHVYNFAPSDSFARFKKMQGYEVFQPMGFDSFGLPAENYAIKTGIHPSVSIAANIEKMRVQLKALGAMFDWDYEVVTSDPSYYRWTQWLFLQFFKKGLIYQKDAPVNWCTSCNTAIANEQVVGGMCERCDGEILKKNMRQWFFKITDYAEELLSGLDTIDWPEKTKAMQRNWIGKSVGAHIKFQLCGSLLNMSANAVTVFTTRADTLMGASYVILAPEHPLVEALTSPAQAKAVKDYQYQTAKTSDIERLSDKGGKSGVFTGGYCMHPITKEKLPVWIADYCLATYGTGAVMGVPAHDTRDYEFAKTYNLPVKQVICPAANIPSTDGLPFVDDGVLINSGEFNGLTSAQAKEEIVACLTKNKSGAAKTNYRLRDWSASRQRYWGCPIPIIHCDKCGAVPVPAKELPVLLPADAEFTPDGKSPLSKHSKYINTACPKCGIPAKRDADTLDTFVCSAWYFLRYPDARNNRSAFDKKTVNKMLPVDKYIGGPEHACMHLLYARFFTKALRDMGFVSFDEPFTSLVHQGMILGADGEKMSKSKGNIVNPDSYLDEYGADALRMYLMFAFSYIEGGSWSDDGIKSIAKFLDRVERIVDTAVEGNKNPCKKTTAPHFNNPSMNGDIFDESSKELEYALHYAIKNITRDLEIFSFNTAIARLMELVNAMYKHTAAKGNSATLYTAALELIKLIAPFTPHSAEELHARTGGTSSIFSERYPVHDETKLVLTQVEIAVQLNSKIISKIMIDPGWPDSKIKETAITDEKTTEALMGREIKKAIVIKQRLINLIV